MRRKARKLNQRGNLGSVESIELPRSMQQEGQENTESAGESGIHKGPELDHSVPATFSPAAWKHPCTSLKGSTPLPAKQGDRKGVSLQGEHSRGSQSGMQTGTKRENLQALSVGIFRKQLQSSLDASRRISWGICALPVTEACPFLSQQHAATSSGLRMHMRFFPEWTQHEASFRRHF